MCVEVGQNFGGWRDENILKRRRISPVTNIVLKDWNIHRKSFCYCMDFLSLPKYIFFHKWKCFSEEIFYSAIYSAEFILILFCLNSAILSPFRRDSTTGSSENIQNKERYYLKLCYARVLIKKVNIFCLNYFLNGYIFLK